MEVNNHKREACGLFINLTTATLGKRTLEELGNPDYGQFLVNKENNILAIRPCQETDEMAFKLQGSVSQDLTKKIHSRIVLSKITALIPNYDPTKRYVVMAEVNKKTKTLYFDMKTAKENTIYTCSRYKSHIDDASLKEEFKVSVSINGEVKEIFGIGNNIIAVNVNDSVSIKANRRIVWCGDKNPCSISTNRTDFELDFETIRPGVITLILRLKKSSEILLTIKIKVLD